MGRERSFVDPGRLPTRQFDLGGGDKPQPDIIETGLEAGENLSSPFGLLKLIYQKLTSIDKTMKLNREADRRAMEVYNQRNSGRGSWRSVGFSYATSEGVKEIDLSNGQNVRHFFISTVPTAADGRFWISVHRRMELTGGVPYAGTWDYVGKLGGESMTFPIPDGMTRLYIVANQPFEGTIYLAGQKDALPS